MTTPKEQSAMDYFNSLPVPWRSENCEICPICSGTGRIEPPREKSDADAKKIMARALRDKGYSIRQITKLCGWKSPRSAWLALNEQSGEEQ